MTQDKVFVEGRGLSIFCLSCVDMPPDVVVFARLHCDGVLGKGIFHCVLLGRKALREVRAKVQYRVEGLCETEISS